MPRHDVRSLLASTRRLIGQFLLWWSAELSDAARSVGERCLPRLYRRLHLVIGRDIATFFDPRVRERPLLETSRASLLQTDPCPEEFSKFLLSWRNAQVDVLLTTEVVWRNGIWLPAATRRHIDSAIHLQMDRWVPAPRESLLIAHVVAERVRDQIRVVVYAVRRSVVSDLIRALNGHGLRLASLGIAEGPTSIPIHLRERDPAPVPDGRSRAWRTLDRWLAWAAPILAISAACVVATQWIGERREFAREMRELAPIAAAVRDDLARLDAKKRTLQALRREALSSDATDYLIELSRMTPAGAWVYDLDIDCRSMADAHIALQGFAPVAASLAASLGTSATFAKVQVLNSLPSTTGAGERWQLSMVGRSSAMKID